MKHVVHFGGGVTSWAAARRVVDRHGPTDVVLLFADTKREDDDMPRFLADCERDLGVPFTRIADGRDIWQVFEDERYIGNSRADPCSKILKRELLDRWAREHCAPEDVHYVGLDWTEPHRVERFTAAMAAKGVKVECPLTEAPYLTKADWCAEVRRRGFEPQVPGTRYQRPPLPVPATSTSAPRTYSGAWCRRTRRSSPTSSRTAQRGTPPPGHSGEGSIGSAFSSGRSHRLPGESTELRASGLRSRGARCEARRRGQRMSETTAVPPPLNMASAWALVSAGDSRAIVAARDRNFDAIEGIGNRSPIAGWGMVYFATAGDTVKIGWAKDPKKRVAQLQTGCPHRVSLYAWFNGSRDDEKVLHRAFAHLHVRGEWFRATPELMDLADRFHLRDAAWGWLTDLLRSDTAAEFLNGWIAARQPSLPPATSA